MRAVVFTHATNAAANAQAFANALDAILGYPRDGVDIGGGIHAPPAQSRTHRWATPFRHLTDGTRYAVVYDDRLQLLTTQHAENRIVLGTHPAAAELAPRSLSQAQYDALRARLLASVELPDDWFPAPGVMA